MPSRQFLAAGQSQLGPAAAGIRTLVYPLITCNDAISYPSEYPQ